MRTEEVEAERYYVWVDFINGKIEVHVGSCALCRNGQRITQGSYWANFDTREEAFRYAGGPPKRAKSACPPTGRVKES